MSAPFGNKQLAIPPGSTVLVTGVTGLIGSHIGNELLKAGFKVRGTTRSALKGQWLTELFDKHYGAGQFELVEVSDMTKSETYDQAMKGSFNLQAQ
jgi:nucleoside-diphosphate-sugar epimerase